MGHPEIRPNCWPDFLHEPSKNLGSVACRCCVLPCIHGCCGRWRELVVLNGMVYFDCMVATRTNQECRSPLETLRTVRSSSRLAAHSATLLTK